MPTYEYKCPRCHNEVELTKSIKDDTPEYCENCNIKMERQISAPGLIFKGPGFYVNDYKKRGK